MAGVKSTPKDAQVMASILKEVGVSDYDPRVLNQMLEFTYRYVTNILEDAQTYSLHAKKKSIDIDDVKLAMELHVDRHFTPPPPRELLLEMSRQKNGMFLPLIKSTAGPRLPPDRYNLTACNYRLKFNKKPKSTSTHINPRMNMNMSFQTNHSVGKMNSSGLLTTKNNATLSVVTKAGASPTVTVVPKGFVNATGPKSTTVPLSIKFSEGNRSLASVPTTSSSGLAYSPSVSGSLLSSQAVMPSLVIKTESSSLADHGEKRKREDDDEDMDYDL